MQVGTRVAPVAGMTTKPEAVPASAVPNFLNVDSRVPSALRDLLAEADGCLKMGFLLGGTVCAQRAIQSLLSLESVNGANDDARLRALSDKYPERPEGAVRGLRALPRRLVDRTDRRSTRSA